MIDAEFTLKKDEKSFITKQDEQILSSEKKETSSSQKRKFVFRSLKEIKQSVETIGRHLSNAAVAGVGILSDAASDAYSKYYNTVVIAGNDNSGKTTLLYTAKFGENFNPKLIVPTVGYNGEYIDISEEDQDVPYLEVYDLGGGTRMGPMFFKYMEDTDSLIYVIRASDSRLVSSLWELYILLQHVPRENSKLPVCILIIMDEPTTDETQFNEKYINISKLAAREALPPTQDKWELPEFKKYVDVIWDSDRKWIEKYGRTSSHGMRIPEQRPDLTLIHNGHWIIMPVEVMPILKKEVALSPFIWVHDKLLQLNPIPSKQDIFDVARLSIPNIKIPSPLNSINIILPEMVKKSEMTVPLLPNIKNDQNV